MMGGGQPPNAGVGGGHGMGMRGGGGSGGVVPFRAGDWKCGADGCGYHNFAKNVTCLRCGASRSVAAIIGDPGFGNGDGGAYQTGPPTNSSSPFGSNFFASNHPYGGIKSSGLSSATASVFSPASSNAFPPLNNSYSGYHGGNNDRMADAFNNNTYGINEEGYAFLPSGIGGLGLGDEHPSPKRSHLGGLSGAGRFGSYQHELS